MKNLKLHKSSLASVDGLKDARSALIINDGELCYATYNALWRLNINNRQRLVIDLSKTTYIGADHDADIVSYTYNKPWDSFFVCCSNGDILLINDNIVELGHQSNDVVVNITCSPDFERVIFVTAHGKVTVATDCFEVINDFNINEVALAENRLVNVGWGKKETQFHGSEGKDKRVVKVIVGDKLYVDETKNVCWRSDSSLFVIGYVNRITNLRSMKIFNRDGVLQYISEPLPGVEAVLSWKPSKELISFPQHFNGNYFISFMEKNGLKHGDFLIPDTMKVLQLLWNHDSSILCIQCRIDFKKNILLFLSCTNYTWQIKKWMNFEHNIIAAKWFPDNSLQLITVKGVYYTLHWTETLCTSSPGTLDWVAVIDYCSVLLTPFKQVIIPPPMFDVKLTLDSPVDSVLYLPHNQK